MLALKYCVSGSLPSSILKVGNLSEISPHALISMYCNYTFSKKNPINLDWGDPALNATVVQTNNNKKQLTEYFHAI